MPTCGECENFQPFPVEGGCERLSESEVVEADGPSCEDFRPAPKPLVDELADELCAAIEVIEMYAPNHPVQETGNQVLDRYLSDPKRAEGFRARVLAQHKERADGE